MTQQTVSQLDLLMVHADDHQPVLPEGMPDGTAPSTVEPKPTITAGFMRNDAQNQNDLEEQRWGVIVPEGAKGRRLLALIEPLIAARRAAQGGQKVQIYYTPPKLDAVAANKWHKKHFDTGKDTTHDLPRYQLILGDLDEVPLSIQQVQAADNYVGRLAFEDDAGYEAYVEKILRWESQPSAKTQARSLLFTVHDQTAATDSGYRSLMSRGLEIAKLRQADKQFNAREVLGLGDRNIPNPDELLREVRKPDPTLLFTLSHGLGPPRRGWRSVAEQHQLQGAMSFGREGVISAARLAELGQAPFLPGGIWFMLACYGAGTPESSAYAAWLTELAKMGQFGGQPQAVLTGLPKPGERPFIAALPKAVLRNDQGPLAFMGHVDLAWTYSFNELDSGSEDAKPGRFIEILRYLLAGDRVGVAFHALMRYFGTVNKDLTDLYDDGLGGLPGAPTLAAQRGHLWMLRQDLAGYVLLGDPAARLPLHSPAALAPPPPRSIEEAAEDTLGFAATPPAAAPAPYAGTIDLGTSSATGSAAPQLPQSIEELEVAFAKLLSSPSTAAPLAESADPAHRELQRLFALYRQGGRHALGIKS